MIIAINTIQDSQGYIVISSKTMRRTSNWCSLAGELSNDLILVAFWRSSCLLTFICDLLLRFTSALFRDLPLDLCRMNGTKCVPTFESWLEELERFNGLFSVSDIASVYLQGMWRMATPWTGVREEEGSWHGRSSDDDEDIGVLLGDGVEVESVAQITWARKWRGPCCAWVRVPVIINREVDESGVKRLAHIRKKEGKEWSLRWMVAEVFLIICSRYNGTRICQICSRHLRQNFIIILPVNCPSAFADIVLVHFQIIQDHINQTLVTAPNSSEWRTSAKE